VDNPRDANAAGLGQRLDARGDIDPVAENVVFGRDDVAEIEADPERDLLLGGTGGVAFIDRTLQRHGTARRLDDAVKFGQRPFAGRVDDMSAVIPDHRLDDLAQQRHDVGKALTLVSGDRPPVTGDQNRRQTAPDPVSRILRHARLNSVHHPANMRRAGRLLCEVGHVRRLPANVNRPPRREAANS
jgi:hypothetical protein